MAKSSKKKQEAPLEPVIEYALTFDGQNNFITCPNGIVSPSYTKEAWVKLAEPILPSNNILSGIHHALYLPHGWLQAGHNGQWTQVKDSHVSPANTWFHAAVTYDSQTQVMCLYRDGRLVNQASNVPPFNPSDSTLQIGSHQSSHFFKGQIAEARVWNKALSQTEIQSNLSRRLVGNEPGLVAYWPLNEGSGTIAHDKTNNAHHGTIQGNPSWEVSTLFVAPVPSSKPAITKESGKVLVFDANSQAIAVGSGAIRPQGRFTIEAWVNPSSNAGKQIVFAEGQALFYLEGGELKFQAPPARSAHPSVYFEGDELKIEPPPEPPTLASSGAGMEAGKWYHVAVTRAGNRPGETKLYINGVPNDNRTAIETIPFFKNSYLAGHPKQPDSGFQGKLLEVRVWRYARSLSEIQANMPYFLTGRELGLIRCWTLTESFGTTIGDRTTSKAIGTVVGDATWEESEIPIKINLNAQERLTRSIGLEDYGYWFREMAKQQKTEADPPFRRGRIWA